MTQFPPGFGERQSSGAFPSPSPALCKSKSLTSGQFKVQGLRFFALFAVLSQGIAHFRQDFLFKRNLPLSSNDFALDDFAFSLRLCSFAALRLSSFWLRLWCAASLRLIFVCLVCAWSFSSLAQKPTDSSVKTLDPIEGDREAQKLIAEIFSQRPEQTFTNALLKIRNHDGAERKVPVHFQLTTAATNWTATYEVSSRDGRRTGASPSPPAEERAGERRPLLN